MSKIFVGIITALVVSGYLYYQFAVVPMKRENIELQRVNTALEVAVQEQKETIEAVQKNLEITREGLANMTKQNQEYESEMDNYLDIFRRHDMTKLANARPGSLEIKANARTKEVFDAIESDSIRISDFTQ